MDTKVSKNDQEASDARNAPVHHTPVILRAFCALHAVLLGGFGGALLMGSYMVGMRELRGTEFDACLYPLGGGLVVSGGNFPQTLNSGKECDSVRRQYLEEQYDKDVEDAIGTAWEFFDKTDVQPDRSQVAVFDIDESALSNRAEWRTSLRQSGLLHLRQMAHPQNRSVVSFMPKHMRVSEPQGIPEAPQESAPALEPTLALYKELHRRGFSITFITGRTESGGARAATAKNLLQAGYGAPCSEALTPSGPGSSVPALDTQQLNTQTPDAAVIHRKLLKDASVDASTKHALSERRSEEPCYVALGMRKEGDRRLASVYKPEQRAKLQGLGYTILASFGDQWSDLSGTSAAKASFLLPNPFYYLL